MVDDTEDADPDHPKDSDDDDLLPSDDDDEGEENIPLKVPAKQAKILRKQTAATIPARSTKAEDRSECTAWYVTFLGVKVETAEYLHDMEHRAPDQAIPLDKAEREDYKHDCEGMP